MAHYRVLSVLKESLLIRKSINQRLIPGKKQFGLFVEALLNTMEGSGEHALEQKFSKINVQKIIMKTLMKTNKNEKSVQCIKLWC